MSNKGKKKSDKKSKNDSSDEDTKEVESPIEPDDKPKKKDSDEETPNTKDIKVEQKKEIKDDKTTPTEKSVSDFDYDAIKKLDVGPVKDLDMLDLIKILIVRGKDLHNPSLWVSCERLLKQLNGERNPRDRHFEKPFNRDDYRGRNMPRFEDRRPRGGYEDKTAPQRNSAPMTNPPDNQSYQSFEQIFRPNNDRRQHFDEGKSRPPRNERSTWTSQNYDP